MTLPPRGRPLPHIFSEEATWLAGWIEGEGSFGWFYTPTQTRKYKYPMIKGGSVDEDVIAKIAILCDVSYYKEKLYSKLAKQPMFRFRIRGRKAATLMRLIYPYMGKRRKAKIDIILDNFKEI